MVSGSSTGSESGGSETPRTVLRGVNHQLVNLWLDSLYLVVEYPHADVFQTWSLGVGDLSNPALYAGVPYAGMVLKRGANGYKLAVWDGDARVFLTDRVEDRLTGSSAAGQGMAIMRQPGWKWLRCFGNPADAQALKENVGAQLVCFGIEHPDKYPMRVNRLDIALDVLGLDMASFSLDEWQRQWVGYAKPRNLHLSSRTGELTGITIGSRKGNVCLTLYDKVTESQQDGDSGFWRSVWGVGEDDDISVTRFEWSFRPYQANFPQMAYLEEYNLAGFLGLLNYASQKWGRLCEPGADRNHTSRWVLSSLWEELLGFIAEWSEHYDPYIRPQYHLKPDITPAYLGSADGWVAGLRARVGIELGLPGPASLARTLSYLHDQGYTFQDNDRKAAKKWDVLSNLAGVANERA